MIRARGAPARPLPCVLGRCEIAYLGQDRYDQSMRLTSSARPPRRRARGSRRIRLALILAALLAAPLGVDSAAAQQAGDIDVPAAKDDGYSGVAPGEAVGRKPRRPNLLTWVGFQPRDDGTALVFVQLTSEVPFTQEVQDGKLVVKLEGARYANANVRRRMDTSFFETAVQQVTSKRVSRRRARKDRPARTAGIELHVTFKDAASAGEARADLRQAEDGYHYLYLELDAPGVSVSAVD